MMQIKRRWYGFSSNSLTDQVLRRPKQPLQQNLVHSALWQYLLVAARILMTLGSTAIMARLLTPADYGIHGMTSIVVEMAALLTVLGFLQILIQRRRLSRIQLDSIFWTTVALGVVLALALMALSWPVAIFLKQPELVLPICASSLILVLREALVVPMAILQRMMRFRTDALVQMSVLLLRIVVAITLAWLEAGYWALVIASLVAALAELLIITALTGYWPRLRFSKHFIASIWHQNGSYLGSGIVVYLLSNFDNIIVGRRFGAVELGYYATAYTLPDELRNRFAFPLIKVLFPSMAALQHDFAGFRTTLFRAMRILAAVVLPIGVGLAIVAESLVRVLYGEQWLPVIPILEVLAIGGATRSLASMIASVFNATGRPEIALKVSMWSMPYTLPLIYVASYWGAVGVAWGMIAAQLPTVATVYLSARLIQASPTDFLRAVVPAIVGSFFMAGVLLTIKATAYLQSLAASWQLVLLCCLGMLSYIPAILVVSPALRLDVKNFYGKFRRR